ncbi:MAG: helix-turn-helix domain-containing protein [Longimicrobiales bacterium]
MSQGHRRAGAPQPSHAARISPPGGRLVLGDRVRALRSERGETQHALAQRAGVNRVSIPRIEAGDQLPRYRTLVALANALDVPLDRLLVG